MATKIVKQRDPMSGRERWHTTPSDPIFSSLSAQEQIYVWDYGRMVTELEDYGQVRVGRPYSVRGFFYYLLHTEGREVLPLYLSARILTGHRYISDTQAQKEWQGLILAELSHG